MTYNVFGGTLNLAQPNPYANLHPAPDRLPHEHHTTQFFRGRMRRPSCHPTNSVKAPKVLHFHCSHWFAENKFVWYGIGTCICNFSISIYCKFWIKR